MEHQCQHEASIATILTEQKNTNETLTEISEDIKTMRKSLNGNGQKGFFTRVALVEQSMGRVWWWLGGVSLTLLAVAIKGIF